MFSLRDLCFVLCSRDLDVQRAQRIMGFFILITHKSIVRKSDHMEGCELVIGSQTIDIWDQYRPF